MCITTAAQKTQKINGWMMGPSQTRSSFFALPSSGSLSAVFKSWSLVLVLDSVPFWRSSVCQLVSQSNARRSRRARNSNCLRLDSSALFSALLSSAQRHSFYSPSFLVSSPVFLFFSSTFFVEFFFFFNVS